MGDDRLPGSGPVTNEPWVCPRGNCHEEDFGVVAPECEVHKIPMVPKSQKSTLATS